MDLRASPRVSKTVSQYIIFSEIEKKNHLQQFPIPPLNLLAPRKISPECTKIRVVPSRVSAAYSLSCDAHYPAPVATSRPAACRRPRPVSCQRPRPAPHPHPAARRRPALPCCLLEPMPYCPCCPRGALLSTFALLSAGTLFRTAAAEPCPAAHGCPRLAPPGSRPSVSPSSPCFCVRGSYEEDDDHNYQNTTD